MSQSKVKSFTESIIQTFFGTMFGFFMTLIVFPLFGIYTTVDVVGGITITFMFIAIFKNYLLRRVFNWMKHSDYFPHWGNDQKKFQSFIESFSQTITGLLVGFFGSIIIYPWFGIETTVYKIGWISLVFMSASVIKNYFVRRYFEKIRIKEVK